MRDAVLGDPRGWSVDIDWLLSKQLATELPKQIDFTRRINTLLAYAPAKHNDTIYISVVDKDRNCVSLINPVLTSGEAQIAGSFSQTIISGE
ncbi:gamma-glutamyltransferase [Paraburkholderia madseniana]|uniref:hypothetical protein n=1 Tax=Paraburkholderia madseniana TaxID=2599607 RepID=UPI0038BD8D6B